MVLAFCTCTDRKRGADAVAAYVVAYVVQGRCYSAARRLHALPLGTRHSSSLCEWLVVSGERLRWAVVTGLPHGNSRASIG